MTALCQACAYIISLFFMMLEINAACRKPCVAGIRFARRNPRPRQAPASAAPAAPDARAPPRPCPTSRQDDGRVDALPRYALTTASNPRMPTIPLVKQGRRLRSETAMMATANPRKSGSPSALVWLLMARGFDRVFVLDPGFSASRDRPVRGRVVGRTGRIRPPHRVR